MFRAGLMMLAVFGNIYSQMGGWCQILAKDTGLEE
jgi:hypothetical protein